MNQIIKNLQNPRFNAKGYYLLLLPVKLLPFSSRKRIETFAIKHWNMAPTFMHRLKWMATT